MSWFLLSSFTEWNCKYIHAFNNKRGILLYYLFIYYYYYKIVHEVQLVQKNPNAQRKAKNKPSLYANEVHAINY